VEVERAVFLKVEVERSFKKFKWSDLFKSWSGTVFAVF